MAERYDLVVIGAGPGGYVGAIKAAQLGLKTAIVEARQIGGTCLNRGCIPTKTLMHSSHLYSEMQEAGLYGLSAQGTGYDFAAMHARKDEVVGKLRDGVSFLLNANKVDVMTGMGKILNANTVEVETSEGKETLETNNILIASGSVPARPPIPGMELDGIVTSDELLEGTPTDYKTLTVIGGGVIGVEFASVFSALGCKVTIIEALDRIIPTMDKEIAQNLSMILKKRGIEVNTSCKVEKFEKTAEGITCYYTGKKGEGTATSQGVLVSIGRRFNVAGLFAEGFEVKMERGIVVDENFATSVPGVYAIGDVIHGGIQLAHVASAQAENAVCAIAGQKPGIDLNTVPSCIYTNPEIASVGISADDAKAAGREVKTGKFSVSSLAKSMIENQERSFIKVVFDAETDVILGAQLMCARATDLVSELATAIVNKLTIHQLASVIRPHPTFTEAVTEAVEDAEGCAIHIAPKRR